MKKICMLLVMILLCITLSACGSKMNVEMDLTKNDTLASSTVTNINANPLKYKGYTLKVRAKFKNANDYYTLNEIAECCNWSFEVKLDDGLKNPKNNKNVVASGTIITTKKSGKTTWYMLINELD